MADLIIKPTKSSPEVYFDEKKSKLTIKGDSYPENSFDFYRPIQEFLQSYIPVAEELTLEFRLIYFNSSTSKVLFDIFDMLDIARKKGKLVYVKWYSAPDNDFIIEEGEEYKIEYPELITLVS